MPSKTENENRKHTGLFSENSIVKVEINLSNNRYQTKRHGLESINPFFFFFGWKLENVLKKVYQIGSELLKCQQKELKQKLAMADGLTVVGWCAMMEFLLSPFILYFFFIVKSWSSLNTPTHNAIIQVLVVLLVTFWIVRV